MNVIFDRAFSKSIDRLHEARVKERLAKIIIAVEIAMIGKNYQPKMIL